MPLLHRYIVPDVHIPGACPTLDGVPCAAAVQGNGLNTAVKGQYAFILQQDNAFLSDAGGQFPVLFFTGGRGQVRCRHSIALKHSVTSCFLPAGHIKVVYFRFRSPGQAQQLSDKGNE